jgi:hypothetical protein
MLIVDHVICDDTHVVASEQKDTVSGCPSTEDQELDFDNLISTRPADSTVSDDETLADHMGDKSEPSNGVKRKEKDFLRESVTINGRKYPLDLVALICYGKYRQYLRGIKSKVELGNILSSLVHNGAVQMDFRGRNRKKIHLNLKLPVVRALKGKEVSESSPLPCPNELCPAVIELLPATSDAWCFVQELAQNPRLRVTIPLHYKFETLKVFLEKKWKVPDNMYVVFSVNHSSMLQEQSEECGDTVLSAEISMDCVISDVAEGDSKPIPVSYNILWCSSERLSEERQSPGHRSLAVLLRIGHLLKSSVVDSSQEDMDFTDISYQESPTKQSFKNIPILSRSPFKKLSHLKNSCYSSPTRKRLMMTPPNVQKHTADVQLESCGSEVNFVTFKKSDMAGESFSTLKMRYILEGVQQQMSDKSTTSKVLKGCEPLDRKSPLSIEPLKSGTCSGSTAMDESFSDDPQSKSIASDREAKLQSQSVQKALQEVKGLSKRKRGKMAQSNKGTQNLLPRPYQTPSLSGAFGMGISFPNSTNKSNDSSLTSTLLLQNVIEQLKVKLLIQALQKQQRQVVSDQFSTQTAPPQLHLPEKQGTLVCGPLTSPVPPVSETFQDTVASCIPTCDSLSFNGICAPGGFQTENLSVASKTGFEHASGSTKLSQTQLMDQNADLLEPLMLNSDSLLHVGSGGFMPTKSGLSMNDHQDASNASFTDLLQGLSDSVDSSLMGMLHHLKSVSPAKDCRRDGIPATGLAETSDLSFESLMALLESPKKSLVDGPSTSTDASDRGTALKVPPVEMHDEDTIDFIKNFQYLSGKSNDTF